jgi:hypothetical protein
MCREDLRESHRDIALNVFRESVRDKVLYNLVFFAILLMGASFLIGQLTAGGREDHQGSGSRATSIFGLFIAVFIGIQLVAKSGAAEHLQPAVEAHQPISAGPGKHAGLVLTLP